MTDSARAKLQQLQQGVWSSLRSSIKVEADDGDSKRSILAQWTPRSSSEEEGGTLENMVRTMFGSCTAFDAQDDGEQSASSSTKRRSRRSSSSPTAQAKRAVNNLREKAEQRESSPSNRKVTVSTRPFPVSSPTRKTITAKNEVPYLVHEAPPNDANLGAAATFDDGISAISAHTLEELDRQHKLKNPHRFKTVNSDLTQEVGAEPTVQNAISKESSLFPSTAQSETEERDSIGEPISFSRGRSNQTLGSKKTIQSQSSESTNFEDVWRQEEQKYWEETVEKDEKKGVRKGSVHHINLMMNARIYSQDVFPLKETSTNTTAGSSALSGMSSQHNAHPHDTFPFDASDLIPISIRSPRRIARDPDRIQDFIVVDALTEIGEI
jgi:hypothetical protein